MTERSITFRILGPIEARDAGDRPIALGGQKGRALLGLLLLNAGRVVSADELAERLWEGSPPQHALNSLQVQVSRLRKALQDAGGVGLLESRRPGYTIEAGPDRLDAARFDQLVSEASALTNHGDPAGAASKLAAALSLWRGPVLADAGLQGSALAEVTRLEEARIAAIEASLEAELAAGQHNAVVSRIEGMVAQYPLREKLWSARMLALYRSDRQADALNAFGQLRALLAEELGIDPSPAIRQLHEAILRQDPSLEWKPIATTVDEAAGLPLPRMIQTGLRTPFIGRQEELDWLRESWQDVKNGGQRVVLLSGEPGIGKSRLAFQMALEAHEEGGLILAGRSDEGANVAYQPFVQALRHFIANLPPATMRSAFADRRGLELSKLVPELREHVPELPPLVETDLENERYRLFEAIGSFRLQGARYAPQVLLLDDLHWADRASIQLLRYLLFTAEQGRMLFIGTYRERDVLPDHPLHELLGDLRRERVGDRVRLEGLSFPEVVDLCRLYAPNDGDLPAPIFVEELRRETQGNPFFIEEVLRHLEEAGAETGHIPWDSREWIERIGIPDSLKEVIARRLARLSDDANVVLRHAAAVGNEFNADLVEHLVDLPEDRLLEAIDEATRAGIVSELKSGFARYEFSHDLIRQALYEQLSAIRRVRLHHRIGETLEEMYADNILDHVGELAYHFVRAAPGGAYDKAVTYSARAGSLALSQSAYEVAQRHFQTGIEILEETESADATRLCELLLGTGDAQWRSGDAIAARATFEKAADLARTLDDPTLLARAALGFGTGMGGYARTVRANTKLIALLEDALAALDPRDSPTRVQLIARLATELYYTPESDRRRDLSDEAVAMAERLDDPSSLLIALHAREWSMLGPDRSIDKRLAAAEEIVDLARSLDSKEVEYQAQFLRQMALLEKGELAAADDAIGSAERLAQELRMPGFLPWVLAYRAMRAAMIGRYEQADALTEQALERATTLHLDPETTMMIIGGQAIAQRISRGGLAGFLDEYKELVDQNPQHSVMRCCLALLSVVEGRFDIAKEAIDELAKDDFAGIARDQNWLMSIWTLGNASASINDTDHIGRIYELLLPYADQWVTAAASVCFGPAATVLGMCASRMKRFDEAERFFEHGLVQTERGGAATLYAVIQREYAGMLLARGAKGDKTKALGLLDEVIASAERLGTPLIAEAARAKKALVSGSSRAKPKRKGSAAAVALVEDETDHKRKTEDKRKRNRNR